MSAEQRAGTFVQSVHWPIGNKNEACFAKVFKRTATNIAKFPG